MCNSFPSLDRLTSFSDSTLWLKTIIRLKNVFFVCVCFQSLILVFKLNLIKNKYVNNWRVLGQCISLVSFLFGGLVLENQDPYTSVIIFIAGGVLLP